MVKAFSVTTLGGEFFSMDSPAVFLLRVSTLHGTTDESAYRPILAYFASYVHQ
jgi:hypothetical protein